MKEAIRIENLFFTYPGRNKPTLKGINLVVSEGEFLLITGSTGCGKSTLISSINGLIPHESGGVMEGDVYVFGRNTRKEKPSTLSRFVSTVFQNPDSQIVSYRVEEEIFFTLENLGLSIEEIKRRVEETLSYVGLIHKRKEKTNSLSGGEKQRLAIASALSSKPRILLLDEPISQLDVDGRRSILSLLSKLREDGLTIVMVEHRIEDVIPYATRIAYMKDGRIIKDAPKDEFLKDYNLSHMDKIISERALGEKILELKGVNFTYNRGFSLKNINLTFRKGEVVSIIGPNGSGKSTLLKLISGILKPSSGMLRITTKNGYSLPSALLLQNPDLMLFSSTVLEELSFSPRNLGIERSIVDEIANAMRLKDFMNDNPFSLSKGQRLRVALGSILTGLPRILLLDEPTTGQDRSNVEKMMKELVKRGDLVIFSTHDYRMAYLASTRVIVMDRGKVINDGPPEKVIDVTP